MDHINKEQLQELLNYARHVQDGRLTALVMRTLDGDSLYHASMLERCTAAYAGAHNGPEFKRAQRPIAVRTKKSKSKRKVS